MTRSTMSESARDGQPQRQPSISENSQSSSSGYGTALEDTATGTGRQHLHLHLDNFDSESVPGDCPYVLTSPRSLEACKRLRVKVSEWSELRDVFVKKS